MIEGLSLICEYIQKTTIFLSKKHVVRNFQMAKK